MKLQEAPAPLRRVNTSRTWVTSVTPQDTKGREKRIRRQKVLEGGGRARGGSQLTMLPFSSFPLPLPPHSPQLSGRWVWSLRPCSLSLPAWGAPSSAHPGVRGGTRGRRSLTQCLCWRFRPGACGGLAPQQFGHRHELRRNTRKSWVCQGLAGRGVGVSVSLGQKGSSGRWRVVGMVVAQGRGHVTGEGAETGAGPAAGTSDTPAQGAKCSRDL